jgi:hypothetical protein
MKIKVFLLLGISLTVFFFEIAISKKARAQNVSFYCGSWQGDPAVIARNITARGEIVLLSFGSRYFASSGYPPLQRCNVVAERLQAFYEQGIFRYITTGRYNGYPVLCVSNEIGGVCQGLLLTLPPDSNPTDALLSLFSFDENLPIPATHSNIMRSTIASLHRSSTNEFYVDIRLLLAYNSGQGDLLSAPRNDRSPSGLIRENERVDREDEAIQLRLLGEDQLEEGKIDEALTSVSQALSIFRERNDFYNEAITLRLIGTIYASTLLDRTSSGTTQARTSSNMGSLSSDDVASSEITEQDSLASRVSARKMSL